VRGAASEVLPGTLGERDHVNVLDVDSGPVQAELDGLVGEASGVPLPVEPFLLGKGHNLAVPQ
jgi:hypothetical protein